MLTNQLTNQQTSKPSFSGRWLAMLKLNANLWPKHSEPDLQLCQVGVPVRPALAGIDFTTSISTSHTTLSFSATVSSVSQCLRIRWTDSYVCWFVFFVLVFRNGTDIFPRQCLLDIPTTADQIDFETHTDGKYLIWDIWQRKLMKGSEFNSHLSCKKIALLGEQDWASG